jgi:hypothetical protein
MLCVKECFVVQMAVEDYRAPPIEELLTNHVQWTKEFTQPKPLGIEKAVAIVTCMDGRVFPAKQVSPLFQPAYTT